MNIYIFKDGKDIVAVKELREDLAFEIAKQELENPQLIDTKDQTTDVIFRSADYE